MTAYEKLLARVAETRLQAQSLADEKKRLYDGWLADNAQLLAALNTAQEVQAEAEADLRVAAVDAYYHDGVKSRDGVTVKLVRRLVYDPFQALAWATKHQMCLALDKKAFEAVAKAAPIECVTVNEEPTAAIDSDLTAWLAKEQAT